MVQILKKSQIVFLSIVTLFRIFLSQWIGNWYPSSQTFDDYILVTYANITEHFRTPNINSLIKDMGYPLFLDFVHLTGLSYNIVLSIIWVIAAILMVRLFSRFGLQPIFLIFIYLFVLFTPCAFDYYVGTRLYRNSIIAPFLFIVFALMLILIVDVLKNKDISAKKILLNIIALSFFFTFTYYIKEDGFWMLPCLALMFAICIGISLYHYFKNKDNRNPIRLLRLIIMLFLPLILFYAGTNFYKGVNYHFFGVYEINTRTEGELGKFVSSIYKIKSDHRDKNIWAPYDAIEKAFDASETLQKYPELEESILNTVWFDGGKSMIAGDFLTWVLRTSLDSTGLWKSDAQINELFAQVNEEISQAFVDGTLEKDDRISLTSSGGSRTFSEILELQDEITQTYRTSILMEGYVAQKGQTEYNRLESCSTASYITNMNFLPIENGYTAGFQEKKAMVGNSIASGIIKLYSILNPMLCLIAIVGFFLTLISLLARKNQASKETKRLFVFAGMSLVYAFGISWFSEFIWRETNIINTNVLKLYTIGIVPMLCMVELFGLYLFSNCIKKALPFFSSRLKKG
ncbi:MAG: hypothetical protein ACLTOZ_03570 [[Clostridium] leptum]